MGTSISTRCLSEAEIKAAHRAKMLQVAEHFVKSVPPWLPDVLSDWSFEVRSQSSIDAIWPTKREMWDSLAHAGDLALQLSDALKQVGVAGFLATNSEAKSEQILEDLAAQHNERAERVAANAPAPLPVASSFTDRYAEFLFEPGLSDFRRRVDSGVFPDNSRDNREASAARSSSSTHR
jgi:hypothetical protein